MSEGEAREKKKRGEKKRVGAREQKRERRERKEKRRGEARRTAGRTVWFPGQYANERSRNIPVAAGEG